MEPDDLPAFETAMLPAGGDPTGLPSTLVGCFPGDPESKIRRVLDED